VNHGQIRGKRVWLEGRLLADEVLIIRASFNAANERVESEIGSEIGTGQISGVRTNYNKHFFCYLVGFSFSWHLSGGEA
jgi:hypothetical protein